MRQVTEEENVQIPAENERPLSNLSPIDHMNTEQTFHVPSPHNLMDEEVSPRLILHDETY